MSKREKETRYLDAVGLTIETRDDDIRPRIVGHAVVFDADSHDLGGFIERIRPQAVDRAIREAHDVRALVDHDPSRILGRTKAGTLRMTKDKTGLRVEIDPPNTSAARDIVESIRRGDVDGMSFAFRTLEDDWHMEGGKPVREVLDMEMSDVSVVTYPAYPTTDVAARSLTRFKERQAKRAVSLLRLRQKLRASE
jgi:HK97 family phage prohead protease